MTKMTKQGWFCALYQANIAEGKCLDINYERLGYMSSGCLNEVTKLTGKREPEISRTCEACPNLPFNECEWKINFPRRKKSPSDDPDTSD